MRPDGGEARRITDAQGGRVRLRLQPDGRWLAYRSGKAGEGQLYRLPMRPSRRPQPEQLTKQPDGRRYLAWAPDGARMYFVRPDSIDPDEKARREKKFTVNIRNPETPLASLWVVDSLAPVKTARLTPGTAPTPSRSSRFEATASGWDSAGCSPIGTNATSRRRTCTRDLYLLEIATGQIERLTNNVEVGESGPQLLAGQPVGGVLGAGRLIALQHGQQPRLHPRGRRSRQAVPQARWRLRRRRLGRLLVARTAGPSTSTRARATRPGVGAGRDAERSARSPRSRRRSASARTRTAGAS